MMNIEPMERTVNYLYVQYLKEYIDESVKQDPTKHYLIDELMENVELNFLREVTNAFKIQLNSLKRKSMTREMVKDFMREKKYIYGKKYSELS